MLIRLGGILVVGVVVGALNKFHNLHRLRLMTLDRSLRGEPIVESTIRLDKVAELLGPLCQSRAVGKRATNLPLHNYPLILILRQII